MDKFCNKIPYAINVSTGEVVETDFFDSNLKNNICCPYCKENIIFKGSHTQNKDGSYRKKHFSHKSKAVCVNKVSSEGESLEHRESKEYIYNLLRELKSFSSDFEIIKLQKEYQFINEDLDINRIADVYCEFSYKGKIYKQAYEIQYSNIDEEEFNIRHNDYKLLGIQDIWFVGMQYKTLSKAEKKEENYICNDESVIFKGEIVEKLYFFDEEDKSRPFAKRVFNGGARKDKLISKSISLYKKVSTFQDKIYLISPKGLYLPKVVNTSFIGAESNKMYDNNYTMDYEEYKKNPSSNLWGSTFNSVYYSMVLGTIKEIQADYKYDNCLLNVHKQELNPDFFINGDNTLFHKKESEYKYEEKIKSDIQGKIDKQNAIEEHEENIKKYKYTQTKYAQIYLIRLIANFISEANSLIEQNKRIVARKQGDSFQWLNKTLLNKDRKDKTEYGLFSSINKVLETMAHITPNESLMFSNKFQNSINDIVDFIGKNEIDLYNNLTYDLFIDELGKALYTHRIRVDKTGTHKVDGLNDQAFRYGIRTCLQNYCLDRVGDLGKGNINLFLYKSIFGENYNTFKITFKKEQELINDLYKDIEETYSIERRW